MRLPCSPCKNTDAAAYQSKLYDTEHQKNMRVHTPTKDGKAVCTVCSAVRDVPGSAARDEAAKKK